MFFTLFDLAKFFAILAGIVAFARTWRHDDELIDNRRQIKKLQYRLDQMEMSKNEQDDFVTLEQHLSRQTKAASTAAKTKSETKATVRPTATTATTAKASQIPTLQAKEQAVISHKQPATTMPASNTERAKSMESEFGQKWSVWLGGLSLALGGIFMAKYSIEQGLVGPGLRTFFGALFALALLVGGELLRRKDLSKTLLADQQAYVPGALTAAGIIAGFATILSAYTLYHFIGPLTALVLMAAMSMAALALSAIQGPGMAALGLVGSFVTPALISTGHPNAWGLFPYLLFVTAASFWTAQARGWLWLAQAASALAVLWGAVWFGKAWQMTDSLPVALYIATLFAMALVFLKQEEPQWSKLLDKKTQHKSPQNSLFAPLDHMDWPVISILAAISVLTVGLVRMSNYSVFSIVILAGIIAALGAAAWRWRSLTLLAPISAAVFAFTYLTWHIGEFLPLFRPAHMPLHELPDMGLAFVTPPELWWFLSVGAVFAAAFGLISFLATLKQKPLYFWTLTAALPPVLIFAYAYLRATNFSHSIPFGFVGLFLTTAYIFAVDYMDRFSLKIRDIPQSHSLDWASGVYAATAVGTLALSFTMMMEKGWLTMALALTTPALAWISLKRPVPALRALAAGMAGIVAVRLFLDPRIIGENLGTTPIFNWLLYGYGVPATAFAGAAYLMAKQKDDLFVQIVEAAAIAFGTVLIALQVRHLMNDGVVFSHHYGLSELAIHTTIGMALSLGMQVMYQKTKRKMSDYASELLGMLGMAAALLGLLIVKNPLFSNEFIGGNILLNELTLAYLVPAFLAGLIFIFARDRRCPNYIMAAGVTSLLLAFAYVTLQTRLMFHIHHGSFGLGSHSISNTENYAYSAVWLIFGGLILMAGIIRNKELLRYAGLPILGLTIAKVFLFDMSSLDGILRAASFMGLGLALVGLGYLYQNFVIPAAQTGAEKQIDR